MPKEYLKIDKLFLKDFRANLVRGMKVIRMLNFDRKASLGPVRVDIAATSACTYNCCFCISHSYLRKDEVESILMSYETVRSLFADLKKLHIKEVLFSGNGEPLLSKALVKEIKENGRNLKIEVLTNGSTLALVDESLFNNLTYLTISLNSGNGASHQITHGYKGENQFKEIVRHIERILTFPRANKKIKLNYVITADNYNEIDDFFEMAIKWNVSFSARPVSIDFPQLRSKTVDHAMLDGINEKMRHYLSRKDLSSRLSVSFELVLRACQIAQTKLEGERVLYPCYITFIQGYIGSNGDVLLCCDGQKMPLGNLNKESYLTIWQKRANVALRLRGTQMNKSSSPIIASCINCDNVRYHSLAFHNIYSRIPVLSKLLENREKTMNISLPDR